MVRIIEPQAFDVEVQGGEGAVLVAFLKKNQRFRKQCDAISDICRNHDPMLRCFIYNEDYLETAMERYAVKGTPTFLLFSDGREVDRLIGESDQDSLDDFIRTCLGK